ncbi:MAG TPA: ATP-binding protein [Bacteroidales bacterium]|nr:ATP-binding protein [Bacteroidales bacterium]
MKRSLLNSLAEWKNSQHRKPLILRGARQVGKTWLLREFGRTQYNQVLYVNFETNRHLRNLFADDIDIDRILRILQIETGINPEAPGTLIIFDELQEAEGGLTALKYFDEAAEDFHIVAAGSLLGLAMHPGSSFPVGKVEFLDLYPMDFIEFLEANGQSALAQLLENPDWQVINTFRHKYIQYLRYYYFTGGMPEAVLAFTENNDTAEVRKIQQRILDAFEQDFSKHAPHEIVPRLRMLWSSIPAQLARENRKFMYGLIRTGARAKEFELALGWLADCGLVHKVTRVSKPAFPLKAYEDYHSFKLFLLDVGLLGAMGNLDMKIILNGDKVFEEFKGSLTEQFVLQQLVTDKRLSVHYWSAERATAEIDFLVQTSSMIIPVEVKAEENLHAKSLRLFHDKYNPAISVRTSMSAYRQDGWLTNIPLFAIAAVSGL